MYRVEFIIGTAKNSREVTGDISDGSSLLEAAMEMGVQLPHECGGMATCGTCYVLVQEGNNYLEFKSRREIHCLVKNHVNADDYRLACQCVLMPGSGRVIVTIPEINLNKL